MTDQPRDERLWPDRQIGRRVRVYRQLDSTNRLAAETGEVGDAILADEQTAGRGQFARTWYSPVGNVYLSVVIDPPPKLARPAIVTAWAGLAVADVAVALTGREPVLKWPNDVLIAGKKVAGILCTRSRVTVVGIGLNLKPTASQFAERGLPEAASLQQFTGEMLLASEVAQGLLQRLDERYGELLTGGRSSLEADWRQRLGLVGCDVRVTRTDESMLVGLLAACSFDELVLQTSTGIVRLAPEAVKHLQAD